MNPFRRKAKEPTGDGGSGVVPPLSGRTFKRSKKQAPVKPELDLSTALPAQENFRTSLLLPNLSARFSMLREDENSIQADGSVTRDDSTILKRSSRFNDLSDIAEAGSIRPPFAAAGRLGSTGSGEGYGTADDDSICTRSSVLNRPRPGEGNVLFGGRQKVYRIPTGPSASTKDLHSSGARILYEPDVPVSGFHATRLAQKEAAASPVSEGEEEIAPLFENTPSPVEADEHLASPTTHRPSTASTDDEHKRETTSSFASGPSNDRSSTAATSITPSLSSLHTPSTPALSASVPDSQARTTHKPRRLYETGLDSHLHEQQSSTSNRLDQLVRQRHNAAAVQPSSPTVTDFGGNTPTSPDHLGRSVVPSSGSVSKRNTSPSRLASLRKPSVGTNHAPASFAAGVHSPPLTPLGTDDEEGLALPSGQRRQEKSKVAAQVALFQSNVPYVDHHHAAAAAAAAAPRDQLLTRPSRSNSGVSSGQTEPGPLVPIKDGHSKSGKLLVKDDAAAASVTGLGLVDRNKMATAPVPETWSALPSEHASHFGLDTPSSTTGCTINDLINDIQRQAQESEISYSADTEVAGDVPLIQTPTSAAPDLRGLVRQHLRTDSNQSSIRLPPSFVNPSSVPPSPYIGPASAFGSTLQLTPSLPQNEREFAGLGTPSLSPTIPRTNSTDSAMPSPGLGSPASPTEDTVAFHHSRNLSSDTKRERAEFANKLAERRKRVEENLRSFVEGDAAGAAGRPITPISSGIEHERLSPQRSSSAPGLFKNKIPASLVSPPPPPPPLMPPPPPPTDSPKVQGVLKGLKSLTTSTSDTRSGSTGGKKPVIDRSRSDGDKEPQKLETIGAGPISPGQPSRTWEQIRRDARRDLERRQRENKEAGRHAAKAAPPSPPSSSSSSLRDRSGSDTSGARVRMKSSLFSLRGSKAVPSEAGHASSRPPSRPASRPVSRSTSRPPSRQDQPTWVPAAHGYDQSYGTRKTPFPTSVDPSLPVNVLQKTAAAASSSSSLSAQPMASSAPDTSQKEQGSVPPHLKRVVQKSAISEPKFVSCTSNINAAVDLTETRNNARNATAPSPPPLPLMNPRRRTRFPGIMAGALSNNSTPTLDTTGKADAAGAGATIDRSESAPASSEPKSAFDWDDKPRSRLWMFASEGNTGKSRGVLPPPFRQEQRQPSSMAPSPGRMI